MYCIKNDFRNWKKPTFDFNTDAAIKGQRDAMYHQALTLLLGLGGEKDLNKAIRIDSKGKQYDSSKMKTARSSRVLAIDEELLARLRFRKTTNPSDKYVFSSSQGKQLNLNNFRSRYFKPAILKTELPIERPYDLRHTFGALMWSRGVKLDRLSRMFGHSSYTTTESWYGTWYREADFSGIETLEKWKEQQA